MIDRLIVWATSKTWFWNLRTKLGKVHFNFERSLYVVNSSVTKASANVRIFNSFTWIGMKSLFWVMLSITALIYVESYVIEDLLWLKPLSDGDKKYNIDQLRLYAQLLTAIFSIYFATIGIILSAGYTRLRRDIIQMLTNEQVGSVYSRVLVLAAMFCLAATAVPMFGYEPGIFVYLCGTVMTLLGALALFPLGQRLFNFFDLNQLVRSEVLPNIARHIEGAANPKNSIALANNHSMLARKALEQLSYIDDRVKSDNQGLDDRLPALSDDYMALLLHYLQKKHNIEYESYWFPRRLKHKQWFLAGDTVTSMALNMSSQQFLVEEQPDHQWFETEVLGRLASHIELAFKIEDFDLAFKLIGRFSTRISAYTERFQFEVGMQELESLRCIIEQAFDSSNAVVDNKTAKVKMAIADTWAALGNNLCLETLRRMMTFEKELIHFFEADEWSQKSLHRLPAFLQGELAFIVERIEFELEIEGQRLSKPKYVQQLAVRKLLQHYAKVLPAICDFYKDMVPSFVASLVKLEMSEAATQVILANLHCHWKLPGWFDNIAQLVDRYQKYTHYTDEQYTLPVINAVEMSKQVASVRDDAIAMLGSGGIVKHIFNAKQTNELPDHFGQIYFELAEACISALEENDESKLGRVFPMFSTLALLAADSKFTDPLLDVTEEFRLHLISTVINDLASVLGFAMLYGAYFDNENLSERAVAIFDTWIENATDKQQYLKRMVLLSNTHSFSMSASPRNLIRLKWKMSFEDQARQDGFGDRISMGRDRQHQNKTVREFLKSNSDASHLFFAKKVVPQLDPIDFKVDHRITTLARRLSDENGDLS